MQIPIQKSLKTPLSMQNNCLHEMTTLITAQASSFNRRSSRFLSSRRRTRRA